MPARHRLGSGQGKAIVGLKPRNARSRHEGVPQGRRTGIMNAEAGRRAGVIRMAPCMRLRTHQELAHAEWIGLLNTVIANGKLARCADGGLCARTGSKWARLGR